MINQDIYLSSVNLENQDTLLKLQDQMLQYYLNSPYHTNWIKGINSQWEIGVHDAQISMCNLIPTGASILEIGCGDGSSAYEITSRINQVKYTGIDVNAKLWEDKPNFNFVAVTTETLPFLSESFDVVLSMFVIEHLVFPATCLEESWRVLKPGGILMIIAPDFTINPMPSEHIGLSYGSGTTKLKQGKIIDALLTTYDSKIRIPYRRKIRQKRLNKGLYCFPILKDPRCLFLPDFIPDCDAIYPANPQEIINYLKIKPNYQEHDLFFRDQYIFGLAILKK